jgi:hypothetical protein
LEKRPGWDVVVPGAEVPVVAGRELVDGAAVVVEVAARSLSDEELHPATAKESVSTAANSAEEGALRMAGMHRMTERRLELLSEAASQRSRAWNERNTVRGPRFADTAEGLVAGT